MGTGGGLAFWLTLPEVDGLRTGWPDTTAYMQLRVDQAGREGRSLALHYRPVPLGRIPEHLRRAVLVSEDAAFWSHGGVDWHEVRTALREAWSEREFPRGASTVTQQLARNLFLSPDVSAWRKLRETAVAYRMERTLEKGRILELYLNVIEFGPGVFGVQAAVRRYFGADVADLTPRQAAALAATVPAPLVHNPATDTRQFRWRTGLVYRRAYLGEGRGEVPAYPAFDSLVEPPRVEGPAEPPQVDSAVVPPMGDTAPDRPPPAVAEDSAAARDTARPDTLPADTAGAGQPSAGAPAEASGAGRKKGSHFSGGDGLVRRLTPTSRLMEARTPGTTM